MNPSSQQKSVVAIIQARMNSTRLPGKTLKLLDGKPVLAHIIERASEMEHVSQVIVATGNREDNKPVLELAEHMGATPFSGSDDNVLDRFYQASKIYNSDFIIRITGDNPFTDVDYGSLAINHAIETDADLSSVTGIPLGTAIELIKTSALERCYHQATEPYHFEHVTPYIKEHPELFSIIRKPVLVYNMIKDLRLTIDTDEDFHLATEIFTALKPLGKFSLHQILNYLRLEPDLVQINSNIIQRPMTHYEHSTRPGYTNSI